MEVILIMESWQKCWTQKDIAFILELTNKESQLTVPINAAPAIKI